MSYSQLCTKFLTLCNRVCTKIITLCNKGGAKIIIICRGAREYRPRRGEFSQNMLFAGYKTAFFAVHNNKNAAFSQNYRKIFARYK